MPNTTAPTDVPIAIPIGRPLLVGWFGVDELAAELNSRLELRLELGLEIGIELILKFGMELILELEEGEARFDGEVASVLDGEADEDKGIDVAVPSFDPMVNKFMASTPGQQLRLC